MIILSLPIVGSAQIISWNDINGVPGVTMLREGANGKLSAVSGSRIYTSTDNGEIWLKPNPLAGEVEELHTYGNHHLVSRNVGGVQNGHQLFSSTDNGETWTRIFSENPGRVLVTVRRFMLSRSGDVYGFRIATTTSSLLNKLDSGAFSGIGVPVPLIGPSSPFPTNLELSLIDNSDVIFAGTRSGGLYASTNFGSVWTQVLPHAVSAITMGDQNTVIVAANLTTSRDGGVFVSSNHGTSWTNLGLSQTTFTALSADTVGNILASTVDGNYYYDKNEGTWSFVGPVARSAEDVLVTRSGILLASSSTVGIFRSSDKGVSWSQNGPRNQDVVANLTLPSGAILAGTLGGRLFKSTSAGANWHQSAIGEIPDYVYALAVSGSAVYAGTDQGVYASTNDGDQWINISHQYVSGSAYTIGVNSLGTIFIGTNFGVYKSTDGGVTWEQSGFPMSKVQCLAVSNTDNVYIATEHDGVFVSTDSGTTWTSRGVVRDDIQTIAVNPAGHVFLGIYNGILRSFDDASPWVQHNFTNGYVYSIAFNGSLQVYAGTYNGLSRSFDDGENWTSALQSSPVLSLGFDGASRLTAGTYHGGVFQSIQSILGVETPSNDLPSSFLLYQNYPNPFNPTTSIQYEIPKAAKVSLRIYNVLGEIVSTLVDRVQEPGRYNAAWDAREISSGLYFYKLETEGFTEVKKMLLIR